MTTRELIDYIKSEFLVGERERQIRKRLKEAGWVDDDIDEGISLAKMEGVEESGMEGQGIATHKKFNLKEYFRRLLN